MDNSPLQRLSANARNRICELALANQQDIHIYIVERLKEIKSGKPSGEKTKLRRRRPLQGLPQTCKALRRETLSLCLAEKKLVYHTHHLERTASGLGSDMEGDRIYYQKEVASLGLVEILGEVREVVVDLGVAHSKMQAPQEIEWDAVVDVLRRNCRSDAVIIVKVMFDWTMVGAADRFPMEFEVGKPLNLKPADIKAASRKSGDSARGGDSAKLPFLAGYMLLRRLVGDLKDFVEGERRVPGSLPA